MRLRLPQNAVAVLHDCIMAALSFVLALYLRLGDRTFSYAEPYLVEGTVSFALLTLVVLLYYRAYRRVWRYTSLNDLLVLARAGTIALLLFYLGMFVVMRLEALPRAVPFIHWMCLMMLLSVGRVIVRVIQDRALFKRLVGAHKRIPVLLVGATQQAEMFIRESERSVDFPYRAVGLIDEDTRQHGREIHHVRIYGALTEIGYILAKLDRKNRTPQRILLTDPAMKRQEFEALMKVAEEYNLSIARLPSLTELNAGESVFTTHPVAVEDILGRPQIALDREAMGVLIANKRVLVTGAGGSIGSELVRQIAGFGPAQILLFDVSEYHLYEIDHELARVAPQLPRQAVLGDVRDASQLQRVFVAFRPEIVFHAAAVKHVPLSEANPDQAILTNILGGKQVADACVAHKVPTMVQVSTDKAVNPTNVMGASKRAAEIYGQMLAQDGATTRFVTVRFGNVLNSTGSVVPLFQKQLAAGGPITVTHRDMTRYFMTISEAVQLVLQAAVLGMQGSEQAPIYVLDMGEPVRIEELACQMIRLAGLRPYEDIAIIFTGLRPGEKMFEELFHDAEDLQETPHPSIRLARARPGDRVEVLRALAEIIAAARNGQTTSLRPLLATIVTDYKMSS